MKKFSPSETEEGIHMEKVTVRIAGRDYSLKTDESAEKIVELADRLEKTISYVARNTRSMNEVEITTMASMILMGEIESGIRAENNAAAEAKKKLEENSAQLESVKAELDGTKRRLEEQLRLAADNSDKKENEQLKNEIASLKQQLQTAKDESAAVSAAKKAENERHATQLADYEKKIKDLKEEHELDVMILKEGFEKTSTEKEKAFEEKIKDNEKMRSTLSNYEASFDLYVKKKEEELKQAHEEIEALKEKISKTEEQIGGSAGVQMTIC